MITIGTLFSGGEGVGEGAKAAGLAPLWGIEYDDAIASVARMNGHHAITASVVDVDYDALPRVDVLHASPPCPNFSVAKTDRGETDADLALADAVCRAIRAQQPRVFTLENVRGYIGSESLRRIGATLAELDYAVDQWVLNSADFGVPQTRERLVLVARAGGWMRAPLLLPRPVPWVGWYAAIEDLIPTLPESRFAEWQLKRLPEELRESVLVNGTSDMAVNAAHDPAQTVVATVHAKAAVPRAFLLSNSATERGDGLREADAPALATTAQHGGRLRAWLVNGTSSMDLRDEDQPATTVVATVHTKAAKPRAWLAAGRVVAMTPRCLARFQSFPDSYILPERASLACRVLGNAVPPLLYQRVIEAALQQSEEVRYAA